jgi:hypothetical protein
MMTWSQFGGTLSPLHLVRAIASFVVHINCLVAHQGVVASGGRGMTSCEQAVQGGKSLSSGAQAFFFFFDRISRGIPYLFLISFSLNKRMSYLQNYKTGNQAKKKSTNYSK